jgi:hypothetical protein
MVCSETNWVTQSLKRVIILRNRVGRAFKVLCQGLCRSCGDLRPMYRSGRIQDYLDPEVVKGLLSTVTKISRAAIDAVTSVST